MIHHKSTKQNIEKNRLNKNKLTSPLKKDGNVNLKSITSSKTSHHSLQDTYKQTFTHNTVKTKQVVKSKT